MDVRHSQSDPIVAPRRWAATRHTRGASAASAMVLLALVLSAVAGAAWVLDRGVGSGIATLAPCVREAGSGCLGAREPPRAVATSTPLADAIDRSVVVGPLDRVKGSGSDGAGEPTFFISHTDVSPRGAEFRDPAEVVRGLAKLPRLRPRIGPNDVRVIEPSADFLRRRRGQRVDLRPHATPVRTQHGGHCMGFAKAAAVELLLKIKTGKDYDLSDLQCDSPRRGAGELIVPERVWPETWTHGPSLAVIRREAVVRVGPPTHTGKLADVIAAIDKRHPVVLQWAITTDPALRASGLFPTRYASDSKPLSHGMTVVGYHVDPRVPGGGYLIIRNSWGTDWGDNGYGYMPFSMCLPSKGGTNGCNYAIYDRADVLRPVSSRRAL